MNNNAIYCESSYYTITVVYKPTTTQLTTGSIPTGKMTTSKMTTGTMTTGKMTTSKMTTGTMTTGKMTTSKMTTSTMTTGKMTTGKMTTSKMTTGNMTTSKMTTGTMTTGNMTTCNMTTNKMTTGQLITTIQLITTSKMTTLEMVTTSKMTTNQLVSSEITANQLVTDGKTANLQATDKITANQPTIDLVSNRQTTEKTFNRPTFGEIMTNELTTAANQITSNKLTADLQTSNKDETSVINDYTTEFLILQSGKSSEYMENKLERSSPFQQETSVKNQINADDSSTTKSLISSLSTSFTKLSTVAVVTTPIDKILTTGKMNNRTAFIHNNITNDEPIDTVTFDSNFDSVTTSSASVSLLPPIPVHDFKLPGIYLITIL